MSDPAMSGPAIGDTAFEVFPAIDILNGECVRLTQGDYDQATTYGNDPAGQAVRFAADGARWVHVVDLDAARSGEQRNLAAVAGIVAECAPAGVAVQVGGGVRSVAAAEALLDVGVTRVVVGTAAVEDPDLVEALAARHRVAVGLDARAGQVAVRGWHETSGATVVELARRFASVGVDAVVVTDIARDGVLAGPDLGGLAALLDDVEVPVVASGGVATAADVAALAGLAGGPGGNRQLAGVVVGRALYEGTLTLAAALAAAGGTHQEPDEERPHPPGSGAGDPGAGEGNQ